MQVGPKASEDVPPGMELCNYSHTRGECMSTGSKKRKKQGWPNDLMNTKIKIVGEKGVYIVT